MGKDEIFKKVRAVISGQLMIPEEELLPEKNLAEYFGADSLDLIEIQMRLEDEFWITIPEEDGEKLLTIAEIVDYLLEQPGCVDKNNSSNSDAVWHDGLVP